MAFLEPSDRNVLEQSPNETILPSNIWEDLSQDTRNALLYVGFPEKYSPQSLIANLSDLSLEDKANLDSFVKSREHGANFVYVIEGPNSKTVVTFQKLIDTTYAGPFGSGMNVTEETNHTDGTASKLSWGFFEKIKNTYGFSYRSREGEVLTMTTGVEPRFSNTLIDRDGKAINLASDSSIIPVAALKEAHQAWAPKDPCFAKHALSTFPPRARGQPGVQMDENDPFRTAELEQVIACLSWANADRLSPQGLKNYEYYLNAPSDGSLEDGHRKRVVLTTVFVGWNQCYECTGGLLARIDFRWPDGTESQLVWGLKHRSPWGTRPKKPVPCSEYVFDYEARGGLRLEINSKKAIATIRERGSLEAVRIDVTSRVPRLPIEGLHADDQAYRVDPANRLLLDLQYAEAERAWV